MTPVKGTTRAEALADGTFAIVMTLLVIELKVPEADHIADVSTHLWAYGASFLLLGTYWIAHYNLFHWVKCVNHPMLWLNVLFLALVSLVPFSTAFLIENHEHVIAIKWYAGHALLILSQLWVMILYARGHDMLTGDAKDHMSKVVNVMAIPTLAAFIALVIS